jgi:phosphoribosylglycinamide formyltransferase-1
MIHLALLSSGDGLGFQAIYDACESGELDAVVAVMAAEKKCAAILRAEAAGTPVIFHPWGPYKVAGKLRATYDRDLSVKLWMHAADLVLLDGWERELTSGFMEMFAGRIIDLGKPGMPPLEPEERKRITALVEHAFSSEGAGRAAERLQ